MALCSESSEDASIVEVMTHAAYPRALQGGKTSRRLEHLDSSPGTPTRARRGFQVPGPRAGNLEVVRQGYTFLSFLSSDLKAPPASCPRSSPTWPPWAPSESPSCLPSVSPPRGSGPRGAWSSDGRILLLGARRVGDARHRTRGVLHHANEVTPITRGT